MLGTSVVGQLWLYDFLHVYLPALAYAAIALVLPLFYVKLNKKAFLVLSAGFALLAVGWLALPTVTTSIIFGLDPTYTVPWGYLYLIYAIFTLAPALLILGGAVFLYVELTHNKRRTVT